MARKLSIMDSGWLMMETRETPMHVGWAGVVCHS